MTRKTDSFVVWLYFKLCTKWESRKNNTRNLSLRRTNPVSESAKKHAIRRHTKSALHLEAKQIEDLRKMGVETYMNRVVDENQMEEVLKTCAQKIENL